VSCENGLVLCKMSCSIGNEKESMALNDFPSLFEI
jgi:hypothetical protein